MDDWARDNLDAGAERRSSAWSNKALDDLVEVSRRAAEDVFDVMAPLLDSTADLAAGAARFNGEIPDAASARFTPEDVNRARAVLERWIDVNADLARVAVGLMSTVAAAPTPSGETGMVTYGDFPPISPGDRAQSLLTIRNTMHGPMHDLAPRVGELYGPEGATIPPSAVAFEPTVVERLESGAFAQILMTLEVSPGTPDGSYEGHLIISPDVPRLAVQVMVQADGSWQ